jgi:hypothetical protein
MKRMVTVPMRSKFCDKAVAAGEPLSFPASVGVKERLRAAAGAIMRVLIAAYERYEVGGRSFGEPSEGCDDLKASVMIASDPKLQFVASVVDRVVDFDPKDDPNDKAKGKSKKKKNAFYADRDRIYDAIISADMANEKDAVLRKVKVGVLKGMVDLAMLAHKRPLIKKMRGHGDVYVYNVYIDCVVRDV